MEITINIPKNTYSVPTEVRPEVVQAICEAFLFGSIWSTFRPFDGGAYCSATLQVVLTKCENGESSGYGFRKEPFSNEKGIRIRGCEMSAAFKALREAGWHIFRVHESYESCSSGDWMGYRVHEKPFLYGADEVTEFTDFID